MKRSALLLVIVLFSLTSFGQTKKVVADKIIATIGDKIILKSDIENQIFDYKRNKIEVPPNAGCLLLEQAMGMKALVVQAERDSIPVSDEEVEGKLDNQIRGFVAQYGSEEILEKISGKTVFQLKEEYRPVFKEKELASGERDKIVGNIRITPDEVKAYYDQIPKDSLKFYESELTIGQIVVFPKPNRDVEDYVINQLKEYKQEVEDGKKTFEALAKINSDDPGTAKNGGLFDLNRNDRNVDATFKAKAFGLKDGQISTPFKSQFGYHIIQMVSRRGDDATVRHILKIPQVSSIEVNQSVEHLDSVRNLLVDGKITFGAAVDKYTEDKALKFTGGLIPNASGGYNVAIDELHDRELVGMLDKLKPGDYSKPVEFTDPSTGRTGVRIVHLISMTEPHRENMKDDYDKIAARALEEKQNDALDDWFQKRLPTFYINVDPEYAQCPEMQKWVEHSTASKN